MGAVYADNTPSIQIWDLNNDELKYFDIYDYLGHIDAIVILKDGITLAIAGSKKNWFGSEYSILILSLIDFKIMKQILKCHNDTIKCLCVLSEKIIASISLDKTIKIWNFDTDVLLNTINLYDFLLMPAENFIKFFHLYSLALLDENRLVNSFFFGEDVVKRGAIIVWNTNVWKPIIKFEFDCGIKCIIGLPNNKMAIGFDNGNIEIWNTFNYKLIQTLNIAKSNESICYLVLMNDKITMASGYNENSIRLWNIATGELIKTIDSVEGCGGRLAVLKDNRLVSCLRSDIKIWK